MKRLSLVLMLTCVALMAVGCGDTTNGNNTNRANANVNANVTNTNANTNANANANRGLSREEFEKDVDKYTKQAKDLGRKVGSGANDAWIWAKTRSVLSTADDLSDSTINVDVENGVITLTGTVATQEQVKKADELAKGIEGQTGVQNKLTVARAGSSTKNTNAKP